MQQLIGCHLSSSKGYLAMGRTAVQIGANTFQFFTRNPRGGQAREANPQDLSAYLAYADGNGIGPVIAHAPYTLNLCSAKEDIRDFSLRTMLDDLARLQPLPQVLYNFHPGSHTGQGEEAGTAQIAQALEALLPARGNVTLLLETMAGKGSEVGGTFASLAAILHRLGDPPGLGVCLDTCHVWDAGYDIREKLEAVLEDFDRTVGLSRLYALHINDSKNPRGSHRDRHEKLGEGMIGLEALERMTTHPALCHLPMVLETPNELDGYAREIRVLRACGEALA